ncbi:hypothetical protein MD588_06945 [Photobacterium sp. SDRW27]|uniref:hypothetical protein n=1 Tax=Photobacterium obscurum TaxID=2829490 RepID=UPI002243FA90|nr:hypothetical protein [Photobacterium obscurum]MCW8328541.1 hypothetical protein [Photobacterium obscurum]
MKYTFLIVLCCILTGCGGDSGSSSSDLPQGNSPQSSLLSDNKAPSDAQFQQFRVSRFDLQPSDFDLVGESLFLKVYLSTGSVLYLGKIDKHSSFSLPVSLPNNEKTVRFDLFSDFEGDQSISREVAL